MWILSGPDNQCIYLIKNESFIIGRNPQQENSINITGDKSVSRKHVIITLHRGLLSAQDCKSTYGTFLNGTQLSSGETIDLTDGDRLTAGRLECVWNVKRVDFITCLSGITELNITGIENIVKITSEWNDKCSHLTMDKLELTDKAVTALASRKHIVSPLYWKRCSDMIKIRKPLPKENDFVPELAEASLDYRSFDFGPLNLRADLFKNKKFLFFSRKQMSRHKVTIIAAGGESVFLGNAFKKGELSKSNAITVKPIQDEDSQDIKDAIEKVTWFLAERKLRLIPESEIALAILHCSIEKFCNPGFSFASVFTKKSTEDSIDQNINILALETQDILSLETQEFVLSLPCEDVNAVSHKRNANNSPNSSSPPPVVKKAKIQETLSFQSQLNYSNVIEDDDDLFKFLPDSIGEDKVDYLREIKSDTVSTPKRKHSMSIQSPKKSFNNISPPVKKIKIESTDDIEWISCADKKQIKMNNTTHSIDLTDCNETEEKELTIIIPLKVDFSTVQPIENYPKVNNIVNFKKFVKVKPLFQNKEIPKYKLSVHENDIDQSLKNNFDDECSDDEKNKFVFETYTGIPRHNFGRKTRKL